MIEPLADRTVRYGEYPLMCATSQMLKDAIKGCPGHERMDAVQRESLDMICHKIARLACGDPNDRDGWFDIAGYATKMVETLDAR